MKLLIVDGEAQVRQTVRIHASYEGYETEEADNGSTALDLCRRTRYDLVILDVTLPGLDGFSVCRELRRFSQVPVIMLSARCGEADRIRGFELGADDYMAKPFSPRELMLRTAAIIKRSGNVPAPPTDRVTVAPDMLIDFTAHMVTIAGKPVTMSPKEYALLFFMAHNRGVALTRERLLSEVWGYDFFGDDRTLDTHIKLLRRSLGGYAGRIATLRGVGYRFEMD